MTDPADEARRERRRELARAAYRRRVLRERYPGVSDEEADRRAKIADARRAYLLEQAHPGVPVEQARKLAADKRYRRKHQATIREKHPAAQARRRDKDPDAFRAKARETYWNDVDKAAARYQRWYQANLEQAREAARNRARLKTRLERLGLPPRRVDRVRAETRRANLAAADAFFAQKMSVSDLQRERSSPASRATAAWVRGGGETPDELIQRQRTGLLAYRSWHAEMSSLKRAPRPLYWVSAILASQAREREAVFLEQRRHERALAGQRLAASGMPAQRLGVDDHAGIRDRAREARDFFRNASVTGYRRRVIAARRRLMSDESPTPQALIDRFQLANEVVRLHGTQRNEALKLRAGFEGIVELHRARLEPSIAEETHMDSVARVVRGAEPLDVAAETEQRLRRAVFDIERDAARERAITTAGLTWKQEGVQELLRLNRTAPKRLEDAIERMAGAPRQSKPGRRVPSPPPPGLER